MYKTIMHNTYKRNPVCYLWINLHRIRVNKGYCADKFEEFGNFAWAEIHCSELNKQSNSKSRNSRYETIHKREVISPT